MIQFVLKKEMQLLVTTSRLHTYAIILITELRISCN